MHGRLLVLHAAIQVMLPLCSLAFPKFALKYPCMNSKVPAVHVTLPTENNMPLKEVFMLQCSCYSVHVTLSSESKLLAASCLQALHQQSSDPLAGP